MCLSLPYMWYQRIVRQLQLQCNASSQGVPSNISSLPICLWFIELKQYTMHYTAWYHRIACWLHLPCFISRCFVKYIVSEYVSGHSGAPLLSNSLQVHSSLGVPKLNNLPADVFSQSIFCNHFSLSYLFELKSQAVQIMQLTEVAKADAGWWWWGVGRRIYQVINNAIPWEIFQSRFSYMHFYRSVWR